MIEPSVHCALPVFGFCPWFMRLQYPCVRRPLRPAPANEAPRLVQFRVARARRRSKRFTIRVLAIRLSIAVIVSVIHALPRGLRHMRNAHTEV
jgi:hypothetical protein